MSSCPGGRIRAAGGVVVALQAANRDPAPHPGMLDVRRDASGHLAFGHGPQQRNGQLLARAEFAPPKSAISRAPGRWIA